MTRPIEVDLLILRALRSGPMHGYGIAQQVRVQSDDILQAGEGSLYPALQRLLLNGRVKAEWGASENNRRARYYTLRPVTPEMDVRVAGAAVSILMWGGYGQERPAAQNGEAPLLRKEAVYPRLESAARFRDRHVGMVVGAAMAHEVGHLLLPKNSHSNIGIMREDLDLKSLRPLGFTAAQSAEIRHALRMWPHRDR